MMVTVKKRTDLFAIAAVCLFLVATAAPALGQESRPTYIYDMSFDRSGFTTVEVTYNSGLAGSGSSWVAVPGNFTETVAETLKGATTSMKRVPYRVGQDGTVHPFYDNLTFSYVSPDEPFSMRITYNMTQGAMIVEPNGFFYSPQIGVPTSARVEATLTLPDGVETLDEAAPTPTQVERLGSRVEMSFSPDTESRIAVTFTVSWPKQTSYVQEGIVEGEFPTRYTDLGARMAALYKQAIPLMDNLFNKTMDRISMRFFIPLSLQQLGIGGYTPIDPSTFETGAIYLNLFYFRFLSGTTETIAMHELTHQYLARLGVTTDLLWVHEGLANYIAVQMGNPLGYDVTSTDADLEAAASELKGNYGMIQSWRPGGTTTSLFEYYSASYKVFKTLGEQYGGLSLYSSFFRGLSKLKDGLRSTNVAVYQLSVAAGADLVPEFTRWGFEVVDLSNLNAQLAKLRAEVAWYGPVLPFRDQALSHLELAERSLDSSPEVALGHITIAAFYIETIPMIIGGILLVFILLAAIAAVIRRRSRRKPTPFGSQIGS